MSQGLIFTRRQSLALGLATIAGLTGVTAPAFAQEFKLKGEPKIAFIYAASAKDGGWNEAIDAGRMAVEKELGVSIAIVENVPEEATKLRAAIDLFVQRGFNIIVGTTYGYSKPIAEAAAAYPDVAFLNASGDTNAANLESFYARTYQGWYLAGLAAGSMSKAKKVGILAGFPVSVVNWDLNAFALGARAGDPATQSIAVFVNSWWDPVKEGQVAEAILEQGADVLATNLSAASALAAAEKRSLPSLGFQLDMSAAAPKGIVTSVIFRWEKHLVPTLKAIIAGTWKPNPYGAFPGMAEGVIDLAPFGPGVPAEVKARVEAAKAEILAGKLDPFTGPIKKQDGTEAVAAGATLGDGDLWKMDFFVEGVIGTMPKS